jgi:hypothetical protein
MILLTITFEKAAGCVLTFCCVDPTAVVRPAATTSAALLVFSPSTPMVFMELSVT